MSFRRSETSLAALLLAQRLVPTTAAPLTVSEYWSLVGRMPNPGDLLGASAADIAHSTGTPLAHGEQVATLLEAATAVVAEVERLGQAGIRVMTPFDDGYPGRFVERLGRSAPPVLYTAGEVGLMRHDLLGIVGSRRVDVAGAETTKQAMHRAARQGFGVVTGAARGVDQIAMNAAIDDRVAVVEMLADSLLRASRDTSARRAIADGQLCLCTPYNPAAGFSVGNAMGRNKLVYALSRATLVVAARAESGGTWAGAVEALRRRSASVLTWTGPGSMDGNRRLIALGARPIDNLDGLFPLPEPPDAPSPDEAEQLGLGV